MNFRRIFQPASWSLIVKGTVFPSLGLIAVLVALALFINQTVRNLELRNLETDFRVNANAEADFVAAHIVKQISRLRGLIQSSVVVTVLETGVAAGGEEGVKLAIGGRLTNLHKSAPYLSLLLITDPEGQLIASTSENSPTDFSAEPWLAQATGPRFGSLYMDDRRDTTALAGVQGLEVAMPVIGSEDQVVGVLYLVWDFHGDTGLQLTDNPRKTLLDRNGEIVADGGTGLFGEDLFGTALYGELSRLPSSGMTRPFDGNSRVLFGTSDLKRVTQTSSFQDATASFPFDLLTPIRNLGWRVVISQDARGALTTAQELMRRIVILLTVCGLVVVVGSGVFTRTLLNPVIRLTEPVERIAAGDLDVPIPDVGKDEVGRLADVLREMVAELVARNREVDMRARREAALFRLGSAVASTLSEDEICQAVVDGLQDVALGYQYLTLFLVDEVSGDRVARATVGLSDVPEDFRIPPGHGLSERPLLDRKLHYSPDVTQDPRYAQGLQGSEVDVPISIGDQVVGVLVVESKDKDAFQQDDLETLTAAANQAALALARSHLYHEIGQQKAFSESVIANSPVAIVIMENDGVITRVNAEFTRLFGYSSDEAIGRDIDDLVHTEATRAEGNLLTTQTREGEALHQIVQRSRKDGSLVDVDLLSVSLSVEGKAAGLLAIYHDVTELQEAKREAEAATQAKSTFLASMSHEIRTPMNAIIGMGGLLIGTDLSPEQREFAEIIRNSGESLLTIINDILDFSKIEAEKMDLEEQPFDLRECVESALDLIVLKAAEKGIELAYQGGKDVPPAIKGDVTRLRQVIINVLNNAVKFTEEGEIVISVESEPLKGRHSGKHKLLFTIRDTGIGMDEAGLAKLFKSFSQVDASVTRKFGGTGLGLAISRRLTNLMGGEMWAESDGPGKGSRFYFTIIAEAAPDFVISSRVQGNQDELTGKRVLIVDDNETNRRILHLQLGEWGMRPRDTASPLEALQWIQDGEAFDLAILDMMMPEMDGGTLAKEIRKHRDATALPLVLYSSMGIRSEEVTKAGFAAYLTKPLKQSALLDTLVTLVAGTETAMRERKATPAAPTSDHEMAKRLPLRILLAEDNAVNQKLALKLLSQMGYLADVAGNGLEALEAVERQTYDVILMDMQMPEMDGLEATRAIRRHDKITQPHIVALTANAMAGDRERCLDAGMNDYLSKPIRPAELVAALTRVKE